MTKNADGAIKARFVSKDISDAKRVKLDYPEAVFVTRGAEGHLILGDKKRMVVAVIPPSTGLFPNIKANQGDFELDKIIISEAKKGRCEDRMFSDKAINIVTVRWFDSYLEEFEATEVRFGSDILFLRLKDGKNRHIPLRQVRWFSMSLESHQREAVK